MKGVLITSGFVIGAIILAPIDTVSSVACLFGACIGIAITWIELS